MLSAAIHEREGLVASRAVALRAVLQLGDVPGAPAAATLPAPLPAQPCAPSGDGAFEVEVASTGQVVRVAEGQSIVTALIEAGLDPLHDCMKGECGVCQAGVLDGVPDHRDSILSEREREAGKVMQICVSRAKSPRLKLDL